MSGGGNAPVIERGAPDTQPVPVKPAVETPAKPSVTPPDTPKKGGYYLDDGPGANPPENIDAIPDAVPRVEPIRPANSRPYSALGVDYTPMTEFQPYKASGIASWYGRRYHGQKTSSGEQYDMYGMTAAHTILPIPSYVRVTNPETKRSVIVRVNDRGPFKNDRIIDLSYAAAHKLNLIKRGSGFVEIELIDPRNATPQAADAKSVETTEAPVANYSGIYIQLGAFRQKENAEQLISKLKQQGLPQGLGVGSWYNGDVYRVRLGPYASKQEADADAANLKQTLGISTLVTSQ
ncbi:MAG: septal ring lytic transglycosylase RlpA family protein [Methylophilales bacterium]|nr:septal ring lytic transglycosylase RlpA family protein [Methylophilales bacterium]